MNTTVAISSLKAVQEPGYANVWSLQDGAGATVARMTVGPEAEAWAKRIETASFDTSRVITQDVASATLRLLVALDGMDRGCVVPGFRGYENGYGEESAGDELQEARESLAALVGHVPAIEGDESELPSVE